MKLDKKEIWHDVLESVKVSVSTPIFTTWISKTELSSLKKVSDNRYLAEILCASSFVKTQVSERYFGLIQDTLIKILGIPCDLSFIVGNVTVAAEKEKAINAPLFQEDDKDEDLTNALVKSNIRLGFTFENFAVASSNQMAFAAAESVARMPGISYNPLFIWGGVGVGKSHLMQAIGLRMLKEDLTRKVLLTTAEEFTNEVIMGIRNKTTQQVREKYRKLQGFFIDDIQFIGGKDTVQEEFFHTFNAIQNAGGQVVMTSDKPPSQLEYIEARLRSRFEAGLIADVGEPNFELKSAIIQIKAKEKGIELPTEIINLIAGNIEGARQIQGFIVSLISESKFKNLPIDENLVKSLLSKAGSGIKTEALIKVAVTPEKVFNVIETHYSISRRALLSDGRARSIARPRQMLMYILRIDLGLAFDEVGRLVGGRDHSTVMHAVETITALASTDSKIREDILGIKKSLST